MRYVMVDPEYGPDEFYWALAGDFPLIRDHLQDHSWAAVTDEEREAIQKLPEFGNGPEYARFALVEIDGRTVDLKNFRQ